MVINIAIALPKTDTSWLLASILSHSQGWKSTCLGSVPQDNPVGRWKAGIPHRGGKIHTHSRNTAFSKTAGTSTQVKIHISEYYNGDFY